MSGTPSIVHADKSTNLYRSYLVRFWRTDSNASWRASAQCVQTGSTVPFSDVDSLLTFLHSEIEDKPNEDEADITASLSGQL